MTLPRMNAINEYWKVVPPLSVTVRNIATYYGVISSGSKKVSDEETRESLFNDMGAMGAGQSPLPQWLKDARAQEAANG